MTTTLKKWGNSLAIRLPREIVHNLALREGSELAIREENTRIVLQKILATKKAVAKDAWRDFVLPLKKRKENVSGAIDNILYGASH